MSVLYVTTITISCDNEKCKNQHVYEPLTNPVNPVPLDWVQVSLPGTTGTMEFCSINCADKHHKAQLKESSSKETNTDI